MTEHISLRSAAEYSHLTQPIQVGSMLLRNRVMIPPHATRVGDLFGSESDALRNVEYWRSRAEVAAWINGPSPHLGNRVGTGFEPTGLGASIDGTFRRPNFLARMQLFADAVQSEGACASLQIVMQGGAPHGASPSMSAPVYNVVPHVLDQGDINHILSEYAFAAEQVARTSLDGVELHMNHDDIIEWFLSPRTNQREDGYGGDAERRFTLARQVLEVVRTAMGQDRTVGVRLNLYQNAPGGFDRQEGIGIARRIEATGLADYLSIVVGTSWGNPSYIQPQFTAHAAYAAEIGQLKRAVSLPVVYTGRVATPRAAEEVLAAGHADIVGMARAHIADPQILRKALEGREDQIRPCIGCNECISRPYVESLGFACAVNPDVNNPDLESHSLPIRQKRVLVVGGGPAGLECAASAAERGHAVALWEASSILGGQLRTATNAPGYDDYRRYLEWQARRLEGLGVELRLGTFASADAVRASAAEEVIVATGATPRRPNIPGVDLPHVTTAAAVLDGQTIRGSRVVVIAQEDHLAPLAVADYLADRGHVVTVTYASYKPASLVSHYVLGEMLGRLDSKGVTVRCWSDADSITGDAVRLRHTYSDRIESLQTDAVVLACGAIANDGLYQELRDSEFNVRVLGDAYAPRRLVFATRQARAIAFEI